MLACNRLYHNIGINDKVIFASGDSLSIQAVHQIPLHRNSQSIFLDAIMTVTEIQMRIVRKIAKPIGISMTGEIHNS